MPISESALDKIHNRESLIAFLRDELQWPAPEDVTVEEMFYDYSADELRLDKKTDERVRVQQLANFQDGQPWGVFLVETATPKLYVTNLRRVLRGLAPAARSQRANLKAWRTDNLLFITTHDYSQFTFAHFKGDRAANARLATFGWEHDDLAVRTPCEFNWPSLKWPEADLFGESARQQWLKDWSSAFDVEKVTRSFFQEYRKRFEEAEKQIKGIQGEDKRLFTQRLFNRLLFIRFLEKKGWLKFNGKRNYLRALWEDYQAHANAESNFYRDRLTHLFFAGLNTPHEVNVIDINQGGFLATLIGNVPYLNGGLFEQDDTDRDEKIGVPDSAIEPILTDLFYRFNFTVTETTPLDIEVAVDPEMLGKIFEELVTGRHETGSYYTPKPIVAYMCRESLKTFLTAQCPRESADAIGKLVDAHAPRDLRQPENVIAALRQIKVCDPACGSGAYLLGMMRELLDLRHTLFANYQLDARTVYERKLEIIEHNLYGVDKDPFAVNIARLRLWLSLIVDFEGATPLPLPNLDFKIEAGDSLTAPNPQGAPQTGFRDEAIKQYAEKKAEYIKTHHYGEKQTLRDEIAKLRAQIAAWTHAHAVQGFDWQVEFAEVFANGGFDAVLANPPYVRADAPFRHIAKEDERQAAIAQWKEYRAALVGGGVYRTVYEKWDLYLPFLERGYQLLHPNGAMVFIIPDAYNAAKYARKSHEFFLQNARIASVNFCSDIPLFDAGVSNTIVHFDCVVPAPDDCPVRVRRWGDSPDDFEQNAETLPTMAQGEFGLPLFRPDGAEQTTRSQQDFVTLSEICFVSVGMVIHCDEKKAQGLFKAEDLVSDKQDKKHPKPYIEGKDIVRWGVRRIRYLEYGTKRAPSMFRRPTFPQLHTASERLMAVRMSGESPVVTFDDKHLFSNHTAIIFIPWLALKGVRNKSIQKTAKYKDEKKRNELSREALEELSSRFTVKFLLAVMNSDFAKEFLNKRRRSKLDIYPDDWKQLPIAPIPLEQQQSFVQLVNAILAEFEKHGYPLPPDAARRVVELEREIDARVAGLYGV